MIRLIECVPNFSEGKDKEVIQSITNAIEKAGAIVLDVDMGPSTNRTVITMAGPPEIIENAAFEAIKVASERIDMRNHKGEHPRIGATDVCPFVPLEGATMEDCIILAHNLGKRVGELGIPVYMYEEAATKPERRNLAEIRKGEYEGLPEKLKDPKWYPDYGPCEFNAKSGATVIGAREFLIAWNLNLNSRDKALASRIAIRLRGSGGSARGPDGERLLGPDGGFITVPGLFEHVRSVGWYIEDYGIAQVSINLLNFRKAPMYMVFEEAKKVAEFFGVSITGSEVVGLIPKAPLIEAGRYYLRKQGHSPAAPEEELIHIAIRSLGLSDIKPFDPKEKIIEMKLKSMEKKQFLDMTIRKFVDDLSSETPTPGGGSVSALCGALASSLVAMVGNLTVVKKGFDDISEEMIKVAIQAQELKEKLGALITEDARAFEAVLSARRLPSQTEEEKKAKEDAILRANLNATMVPLEVMRTIAKVTKLAYYAAQNGYDACLSDAGVAASVCRSGLEGAYLNVLINIKSISDNNIANSIIEEANKIREEILRLSSHTLEIVVNRLS